MKLISVINEILNIGEHKKSPWTLEASKDYISQFSTMDDFEKSEFFRAIKLKIYRDYGPEMWAEITKNLFRKLPGKKEDDIVTQEISKQFSNSEPEWDFSNVSYRFIDGRRILDGFVCHKKNKDGTEHGVSNNISVKDLKKRGNGCRICGRERISTKVKIDIKSWIESFPKERNLIFNPNNFFYKSDNLKNKTLFVKDVICTNHKEPFVFGSNGINVHNLRKGKSGCPVCNDKESGGEREIIHSLKELGYSPIKQKKFEGCYGYLGKRHCDLLRFDAYFRKEDGREVCIEFDGIQHYEVIPFFGGEEALKALRERDLLKTQYCKENQIQLIRIPYWERSNIKEILRKELGEYNKSLHENILRVKKLMGSMG